VALADAYTTHHQGAGWIVEYKIDIDEEKLIVISLWR